MTAIALLLGALVWFVTTVIVDGEICKPIRAFFDRVRELPHDWVKTWPKQGHYPEQFQHEHYRCSRCQATATLSTVTDTPVIDNGSDRACRVKRTPKLSYLVNCHMCAGTWVGLVVGFVHPLPITGNGWVVARILSGLVYKAVAHLILAVNNLLERSARGSGKA